MAKQARTMPRKATAQNAWRKGKAVACAMCSASHGALSVDQADGRSYCAVCWRAYYGVEPPEVAAAAATAALAARASAISSEGRVAPLLLHAEEAEGGQQEAEAEDSDGGGFWGSCGLGEQPPAATLPSAKQPLVAAKRWNGKASRGPAQQPELPAAPPTAPAAEAARSRQTQAPADSCRAGQSGPGRDDQTPRAAELASDSQPQLEGSRPLSRFGAEVAELRRRCDDSGERSAEAEEQQREELGALEAIYGEALKVLSQPEERPLLLRLELPTEVEDGGPVDIVLMMDGGQVPAGAVAELPPVALLCALPGSYPLEGTGCPPLLVEAEHLPASQLEELEGMLRGLADEHAGEPLLFYWASALQERLLQARQLVLPQAADAMEIALRLLSYDERAREERRNREMQVCMVCFDDVVGTRGVFLGCGHFGCKDCLVQMARLHTAEAEVQALRCPTLSCREAFSPEVLRVLLEGDVEALARWEEISLRQCLERMEDVVFCPRCDADGSGQRVPCIEDEDHMAKCSECFYVFCGQCRGVFHPGSECPTVDDRIEALQARAAGPGPEASAAQAELLTLRHLAKTTKACPCCSMAIEKYEGCSKVLCGNCKIHFCWRCGKEITGYDHFATSDCRLFDDEEIRRWNQRVKTVDMRQARAQEARFLAQFVKPAELDQNSRQCPRCKAAVGREGKNNHMRCHACQTQFCARCREVLPKNGAGDHFQRLRICPQHSDD